MLVVTTAQAQDTQIVRALVTSISGQSAFIDKGRTDGIAVGMEIRLFPPAGAPIIAIVRAVSASSSRADIPVGLSVPPVGTQAEIEVPIQLPYELDVDPPEPDDDDEKAPAHPPWEQDLTKVDPDSPLLAPVHRQQAKDRAQLIRGRIYFSSFITRDDGSGRGRDSFTGRVGTSLLVINPLGHGGSLRFSGELDGHNSSFNRGGSTSDAELRIERLSYTIGGQDYAPYRLEVGRFYSTFLPELGLIDGVEGVLQLKDGVSIGAGTGMLPRNNRNRDWDGDIGTHIFVNYESDDPGELDGVLGYQKTWHDGAEDRDQVIGRLNWKVNEQVRAYGSFRADLYNGTDAIKGSGLELTEFRTQLYYTPTDIYGGSAAISRFRWPELLRADYRFIPIQVIRNGRVDRVSLSAWWKTSKTLRVSGNTDFWNDTTSSGSSGDLRFDWSNLGEDWPTLHASVFFTDGSYNSGQGFRLKARKQFGEYDVFAGYELFDYDISTGTAGSNSVIRHLLRGGVNWTEGRWNYSINGDYYFGDSDSLYTLGVYISYRF